MNKQELRDLYVDLHRFKADHEKGLTMHAILSINEVCAAVAIFYMEDESGRK